MWQLLNTVWSGVWIGCAYAVIGMSMVLSFRANRVINLAVGGVFVMAGMQVVWLQGRGYPPILGVVLAVCIGGVLFAVEERALLRRLVETSAANQLLATLAFSIVVAGLTSVWLGRDPITGRGLLPVGHLTIGGLRITWNSLLFVGATAVLAAASWWLSTRWRMGRAASASGHDPFAARLIGLNVDSLRLLMMALAGVVAGLGAALFIPLGVLDFSLGLRLTLFGFVAAAVSGYRSLPGVALGGIAFGVIDALGTAYVSSAFGTAVSFTVLIGIALASQRVRARSDELVTV